MGEGSFREFLYLAMFFVVQTLAQAIESDKRDRVIDAFNIHFTLTATRAEGRSAGLEFGEEAYARYERYLPLYNDDVERMTKPNAIPFRCMTEELLRVANVDQQPETLIETTLLVAALFHGVTTGVTGTLRDVRLV